MRVLAAKHGVNLDHILLPLEGVQIVGNADQIHFRRQLVGGMAPVAIGEDTQAAGGECLDLVLYCAEVGGGVLVPLGERARQFGRLFRIGLERVDDVHPVERVQMIEVNDVILHVLGRQHDVADQLGCRRNRNT